MFRVTMCVVFLVVALACCGCEDKEKIQMAADIEAQQSTIESLRHQLELKTADYNHSQDAFYAEGLVADSLEQELTSMRNEVSRGKKNLQQEKHRVAELQEALEKSIAVAAQIQPLSDSLSAERDSHRATQALCDTLVVVIDQSDELIALIRPWYFKWRYDATERNFLEKLFGADKAPIPDTPEPAF